MTHQYYEVGLGSKLNLNLISPSCVPWEQRSWFYLQQDTDHSSFNITIEWEKVLGGTSSLVLTGGGGGFTERENVHFGDELDFW